MLAGISFAGMFIGGLILSMVLGSRTFPSPYETQAAIIGYFAASGSAVLGLGLLHTLAAIPLTIFTTALARALPDALPRTVAQHAGVIAAVFLLISAMCDIALVSGGGITGEALRRCTCSRSCPAAASTCSFLGSSSAPAPSAWPGPRPERSRCWERSRAWCRWHPSPP
ncbi:hypothetical protein ABZ907_45335 [Nonomuraea wenchangensis]